MQEENPGANDRYGDPHFLGRFWFKPSTGQLYVYSRGVQLCSGYQSGSGY